MGMRNKKNGKLLMGIGLLFCILLFAERLTGELIHAVLGLILAVVVFVHMYRQRVKIRYEKPAARLTDWVIISALAVLVITGILLHPLHEMLILKILHKLAAVCFVIGMIVHLIQHRKGIRLHS